jgi:hypothetical protein
VPKKKLFFHFFLWFLHQCHTNQTIMGEESAPGFSQGPIDFLKDANDSVWAPPRQKPATQQQASSNTAQQGAAARSSSKEQQQGAAEQQKDGEDTSAPLGGGGCIAVAFAGLGVISSNPEEVKQELDKRIAPVLAKFNQQRQVRGQCAHDPARVGIRRDQWHPDVIKLTLSDMYRGPYTFRKQQNFNWVDDEKGLYIVYGILNRTFLCPETNNRYPHDGHDEEGGSWAHCIAKQGNEVYDAYHGKWVPISVLWLDAAGIPDPQNGYLKHVDKVYCVG